MFVTLLQLLCNECQQVGKINTLEWANMFEPIDSLAWIFHMESLVWSRDEVSEIFRKEPRSRSNLSHIKCRRREKEIVSICM